MSDSTAHDAMVGMLMTKLALTYGKRFTSLYEADPATVRAFWSQELLGVSEAGFRYAMDRLPAGHPPNVLEFRMLACNRPADDYRALPPPMASASVKQQHLEALRGMRELFSAKANSQQDPLAWAERILANPEGKSATAVKWAKEALAAKGRL